MEKHLLALCLLLSGCSTADERIEKKRMKNNVSSEKIYRLSTEKIYKVDPLELAFKKSYPWENETSFPKITMDTLRCKGIKGAKIKVLEKVFEDCEGLHDHGLPYKEEQEFIYPSLISLLNKVQNSLNKKVEVTSGHRCPKHHDYLTKGKGKISRYMMGCRADFTVKGLENSPDIIIEEIIKLYPDQRFSQIKQSDGSILWSSKEFHLSILNEGEHSIIGGMNHPVVSVDVRYDKDKEDTIILDWDKCYNGFIRH